MRTAPHRLAALLDSLATPGDRLWPVDHWPPMRFDRPLGHGALGGHGPIRYVVDEYVPGSLVRFRFIRPRGFHGTHTFAIFEGRHGIVHLRHTIDMQLAGWALVTWPLIFRPLHDALIEDALDRAGTAVDCGPAQPARWSRRVRVLRGLLARLAGDRLRRRRFRSVAAFALAIAGAAGPPTVAAQSQATVAGRLIPFTLRDQFGREHTAATYAHRPAVVIGCDRGGSAYGASWAAAFRAAAADGMAALSTIPVASLRGVPRPLRRIALTHFSTDTTAWSLLDWQGTFASTYEFASDACTLLAFDSAGLLARRAVVRSMDTRQVTAMLDALRARGVAR